MLNRRTRNRIVLVALLLAAGAILVFWLAQPDPRLVNAQFLQQRLAGDDTHLLPLPQQLELRSELRSELQQLSHKQRRLLRADRRRLLIAKIDRYRALSKAEQIAFLDREIDRLIALRREEKRAAAEGGSAGATGRERPGGNADDREQSLKQKLDATTPEDRAKLGDYGKQMLDRAQTRGVVGADFPGTLKTVLVFY